MGKKFEIEAYEGLQVVGRASPLRNVTSIKDFMCSRIGEDEKPVHKLNYRIGSDGFTLTLCDNYIEGGKLGSRCRSLCSRCTNGEIVGPTGIFYEEN